MEKLIEEIRNEMKEVFSIYEKIKPLVEELIAYISKYKEGDIHEAKNGVEEIMQKIIKTLGGEDKFPIVEPISKPEYLFFRNLMIGRDVTKNYSKKHLNFLNRCLGELSKILNPIEVGDFVENGTILIH